MAELQDGKIYECSLLGAHGLADLGKGAIFIDPRASVVDTVIHELLHRRRPWWSETAVARHTAFLMSRMTNPELGRWWRAYKRIKKPHRPVTIEDDDA